MCYYYSLTECQSWEWPCLSSDGASHLFFPSKETSLGEKKKKKETSLETKLHLEEQKRKQKRGAEVRTRDLVITVSVCSPPPWVPKNVSCK